jgi:hypothetical protein
MVELLADLIKGGLNEKNHVSLNRVLSASACIDEYVNAFKSGQCAHALAWRVHSTATRPPVAACLRWCVSGVQGALRERVSPPAEDALVAVAPPLTARLISSTRTPACTKPPLQGMLRWCRRCWSTALIFRFGFTPYAPFCVVLKVVEALLLIF